MLFIILIFCTTINESIKYEKQSASCKIDDSNLIIQHSILDATILDKLSLLKINLLFIFSSESEKRNERMVEKKCFSFKMHVLISYLFCTSIAYQISSLLSLTGLITIPINFYLRYFLNGKDQNNLRNRHQ